MFFENLISFSFFIFSFMNFVTQMTPLEIDKFLQDDERKSKPLSEQLQELLYQYDLANELKHAMTRTKRTKAIKNEIASVRRKMAMGQNGNPGKRGKSKTSKKEDESDGEQTDHSNDEGSSEGSASESDGSDNDNNDDEEDADEESPGYKTRRRDSVEKTTRPIRGVRNKSPSAPPKRRGSTASVTAPEAKRVARKRSLSKRQDDAPQSPKRRASQDVGKEASKETAKESSVETPTATPVKKSTVSPLPSSSPQTGSPSGVNRRTAVLFTRKAAAAAFRKPEAPPTTAKRRVGRPRKNLDSSLGITGSSSKTSSSDEAILEAKSVPSSESFRVYRSGGEIPAGSDESENDSEGSSSAVDDTSSSSDEDASSQQDGDSESDDSQSSNGAASNDKEAASDETSDDEAMSRGDGKLEPLGLVWAKCRGYPWYPALIIDPDMPKSGIIHKGVPIPAPPSDVLALASNYTDTVYLVLFFDTKRTWQWLPRNKIDQFLGKAEQDQEKLFESKKPAERKAVRKAYQEAMLFKHQVTGQLQKNLEQRKKKEGKDNADASNSDSSVEED